jgi:predicted anti-sigma-YlaC factor YlaD
MDCVEALDLVGEAFEDALTPDTRARFEDHLAECAACRTYVEQLRLTLQALERLTPEDQENPRRTALLDAFKRKFQ